MRKLNLIFGIIFLLMFGAIQAQLSCYNVVAYLPSWVGATADIDYTKYTHINYAFGIPNTNGTIGAIENSSKLSDLVARGHASNTKVFLAVGGWLASSPSNTPFDAIAVNSGYITTFVNACANLITQYNLDGIDLDWEYPTSQAHWNALVTPLATKIHSMGKQLSAAVPANGYNADMVGVLTGLDLVNIMAYDCACPTVAPYSQAVDALNYWTGRGVEQSKRMLGVPFYSSDNYTSLHVQKANLAKTNAGGIMIWDIGTYWGDINAIVSTLGTICKGITPTCNTINLPGSVQAENFCTMSGIQLETTSDAGGGQNVGYIDAGDWMSYKVNVPTTGTYTVQYRIASQSGGGSIKLEKLGGGTTFGTISVPSTGGWQTWQTISQSVTLTAGTQDIAIAAAAGGFNINWFSITSAAAVNVAKNKTATATSIESASYAASMAVDGSTATRWASAFADNQSYIVDLGANYNINKVVLNWEAAYAKNFQIQTSTNNSTWTTIYSNSNATGGVMTLNITGLGRYVKMNGITRGTVYGFSLWEFEVYGTLSTSSALIETEVATNNVNNKTSVFPNPAYENLFINTGIVAGVSVVDIFDAEGRIVYKTQIEGAQGTICVSDIATKGLVIIRISNASQTSNLKAVLK